MPGNFEKHVKACGAIAQHYCAGLQAMRDADKRHVKARQPHNLTGSVDVDTALKDTQANANRWDYGIGYKSTSRIETVHWVEVHPATDGQAAVIQKKLDWLKEWVKENAPNLAALPRKYVWISSGKTKLTPTAPALRRLAQAGVVTAGSMYEIT